jgi:ABC-type transport system involved in cytochrome bd biosynthesis fused ATPase/permease subunit
MINPFRTFTRLAWAISLVALLLLILFVMSWCSERARGKQARAEATVAAVTGNALDKVASETPVIRQDQEEKQRAVDELQGADQRLPDGFGADLERVRRGAGKSDAPR